MSVVGDKVASPVFAHAHFIIDFPQSSKRAPKPMPPRFAHCLPVEEAVTFKARKILLTKSVKQMKDRARRVPTIKKHIFRADSAPSGFASQLRGEVRPLTLRPCATALAQVELSRAHPSISATQLAFLAPSSRVSNSIPTHAAVRPTLCYIVRTVLDPDGGAIHFFRMSRSISSSRIRFLR